MYFPSGPHLFRKVTILEGQNVMLEQHFQLWAEDVHIYDIFTKIIKIWIFVKMIGNAEISENEKKRQKTHFSAPGRKCCSSTMVFNGLGGGFHPVG